MVVDHKFLDLISNISILISIIPVIVGLIRIKFIKGCYKPLFIILIVSILTEILNTLFGFEWNKHIPDL